LADTTTLVLPGCSLTGAVHRPGSLPGPAAFQVVGAVEHIDELEPLGHAEPHGPIHTLHHDRFPDLEPHRTGRDHVEMIEPPPERLVPYRRRSV
jgi:hypothetical protein